MGVAGLGHISVGRVAWYTDQSLCFLVPLTVGRVTDSCHACQDCLFSCLSRLSPQALTLFGVAKFITWCLKRSFLGECRQGPRHFCVHQACLDFKYQPKLPPSQNITKVATRNCSENYKHIYRKYTVLITKVLIFMEKYFQGAETLIYFFNFILFFFTFIITRSFFLISVEILLTIIYDVPCKIWRINIQNYKEIFSHLDC